MGENPEFYIDQDGKQVKLEIPEHGMLGLLAYGDIGLRAWRKVRQAELEKRTGGDIQEQSKTAEKENNE